VLRAQDTTAPPLIDPHCEKCPRSFVEFRARLVQLLRSARARIPKSIRTDLALFSVLRGASLGIARDCVVPSCRSYNRARAGLRNSLRPRRTREGSRRLWTLSQSRTFRISPKIARRPRPRRQCEVTTLRTESGTCRTARHPVCRAPDRLKHEIVASLRVGLRATECRSDMRCVGVAAMIVSVADSPTTQRERSDANQQNCRHRQCAQRERRCRCDPRTRAAPTR